jgi:hypothetical protein
VVKKALIQKRVHPHIMRHTFATTLLDIGNYLKTVQALMGHSHIRTTERYLHSTDDRKVEAIRSLIFGHSRRPKMLMNTNPQHFLSYWKPETAAANLQNGGSLNHAASNQYHRVSAGDTVWIVTVRDGQFILLGAIHVSCVTDGSHAAKSLATNALWDADFHLLTIAGSSHPIQDIIITRLAPRLRFLSRAGNDHLIISNGKVNPQQLQTMRVLTPDSVTLLQEALTNRLHGEDSSSAPPICGETSRAATSRETDHKRVFPTLRRLQAAGRKSGDLLKGEYRTLDRAEIPLNGLCYVLSECMYHLFPGLFTPYRISWGDGTTHWFLRFPDGNIIETIAEHGKECCDPNDYETARRVAFFTKTPSKRARMLLERSGLVPPP